MSIAPRLKRSKERCTCTSYQTCTNTIRHGDVCLLGASDPYVIEVKSSTNINKRIARQTESIKSIHDYLEKDEAENARGVPIIKRVELSVPEVNYIDLVNEMINEALRTGCSISNPEPGIRYIILGGLRKPNYKSIFSGIDKAIVYTHQSGKERTSLGLLLPIYSVNYETRVSFMHSLAARYRNCCV